MTVELNKKYNNHKSVLIFKTKAKPKPSIAYNTYWKFASERQRIFLKRFNYEKYPWTNDEILEQYKFTNVYRATDRVSQYLIKNVIYKGCQNPEEIFFRIILFKIFNRISTWEILESETGIVNLNGYSFKQYDNILSEIIQQSTPIYSAAYIMASGKSKFGYERKHQNHLKLIELMIEDNVPYKLQHCCSMSEAYNLLLAYPTIGEFLAYQYVTDINYSSLTNFTEMEFVKAGPGAKDGILKCFQDFGDYSFEDIIRMMAENQLAEFERLDIEFKNLWGRDLQLIDCQNIFCEVDKYSRIAHPQLSGYSHRTRIKQKFIDKGKDPIEYKFPRSGTSTPIKRLQMSITNNVFISHHGKDDIHVQRLKQRLISKGYQIRNGSIDSTKHKDGRIPPDAVVSRLLRRGISWAGTFICLIGKETHSRPWVNYEIRQAHLQGKRIVGIYAHGSNNAVELPEAYKKYGSPVIGWNSVEKLGDIISGTNFPAENPDGTTASPIYSRTTIKC